MSEKIIKDIRYFESDREISGGTPSASYAGAIYEFPQSVSAIGQRIARKLHEYGFRSGSFDHIYINFNTALPPGKIVVSEEDKSFKWLRYFNVGLPKDAVNAMSAEDKETAIIDSTFHVLSEIDKNDEARLGIIDRVREETTRFGTELEIKYMTKETREYKAIVSFQINPGGAKTCANLEFFNKKKNAGFKTKLFDMWHYDVIYYLIDSISIKDGWLECRPKASFSASLYNKEYQVPIRIHIDAYMQGTWDQLPHT